MTEQTIDPFAFTETIPAQHSPDELHRIEEKLQEIINDFIPNSQPFTITLMKQNPKNGKNEQLTVWECEAPLSPHEIGALYGGGKYEIYIKYKKNGRGPSQSFKGAFTLSGHYDKLAAKPESLPVTVNGNNPDILQLMIMQQAENQKMFTQMMAQSLQSMTAVLTAVMSAPKQNNENDLIKTLLPTLIQGNNDKQNLQFEATMQAFNNGLKIGQGVNKEDSINWQEVIQDVVKTAPDILGSIMPSKIIRKKFMSDPRTRPIMEDPEKRALLLQQMQETHGQEKANRIIKKAGLQEFNQAPAEQPAPILEL